MKYFLKTVLSAEVDGFAARTQVRLAHFMDDFSPGGSALPRQAPERKTLFTIPLAKYCIENGERGGFYRNEISSA